MSNITAIDWCAFRSKKSLNHLALSVSKLFEAEDDCKVANLNRGWNGYESTYGVSIRGKRVGFIASGGIQQRDWSQVNLTGDAIPHIPNAAARLTDAIDGAKGQLKRVDLALTVSDRSVTVQTVLAAYNSGGFRCAQVNPSLQTILPGDPVEGTTVYIGKRTQPKFVRAYEKGYEMLKQWNNVLSADEPPLRPEDVPMFGMPPLADIFRVELELKIPADQFPLEVLERSDSYFAGAYPYLSSLVDSNPQIFVLTPQRKAEMDLDQALAHIRKQWGPTLFTALAVHHGDFMAVWDKVVGAKHSESLIERGVMFADA